VPIFRCAPSRVDSRRTEPWSDCGLRRSVASACSADEIDDGVDTLAHVGMVSAALHQRQDFAGPYIGEELGGLTVELWRVTTVHDGEEHVAGLDTNHLGFR
jgi:hypothetical protein